MNKTVLCIAAILVALNQYAQDLTGDWFGELNISGMKLPMVFHVVKTADGYVSTADSPSQKVTGMPVSETLVNGTTLVLDMGKAGGKYEGALNEHQELIGVFQQGGQSFELVLSHTNLYEVPKRPQQPIEPFPYYTEEVTFQNASAKVTLSGTLTLPSKKGKFPVVILISGSGPQDRNESLLGHQPFAVLADYLTRNGIGVLRYDDRGVGQSTGNFATATTTDFSTDAEAALTYLLKRKDIDKSKIGMAGHSEGGIIAPMVAARNKKVAFVIMLAGTGLPGSEILLLQQELIARAENAPEEGIVQNRQLSEGVFAIIHKDLSNQATTTELTNYLNTQMSLLPDSLINGTVEEAVNATLKSFDTPWMKEFIRYDPRIALGKVSCPLLALIGSKDLQVPSKENLAAIHQVVQESGKQNYTLCELEGMNHLFQECNTGSPSEYSTIEQTFSPIALAKILDWMKDQKMVK